MLQGRKSGQRYCPIRCTRKLAKERDCAFRSCCCMSADTRKESPKLGCLLPQRVDRVVRRVVAKYNRKAAACIAIGDWCATLSSVLIFHAGVVISFEQSFKRISR